MNDFQGEGKSCGETVGSKSNKTTDDQTISVEGQEYGQFKRSNSGQIASTQAGDTGK